MAQKITRANPSTPDVRFEQLFDAHYRAIHRYCVRRLGGVEAEDAAADVFVVAWRRLDEMPDDESSRAWLFAVAYRVVGNRYRSRRRQRNLGDRVRSASRTQRAEDPSGPVSDAGPLDRIKAALDELSRADRELLKLSSWDELDRSDIAYILGISENAVDQRLHRARARLRARMQIPESVAAPSESEEAAR